MVIELKEGFKKFPKYEKGDLFSITKDGKEYTFPASLAKLKPGSIKSPEFFISVICRMADTGIKLRKDWVKTGVRVYEKSPSDFTNSFLKYGKEAGNLPVYRQLAKPGSGEEIDKIEASLTEKFKEKFRGRSPRITHAMAVAAYTFGIPEEDIVDSFDIDRVKLCLDNGSLTPAEITILIACTKEILSPAIFSMDAAAYAERCYSNFLRKGYLYYKDAGDWICNHPDTDKKLLKKVAKYADSLTIKRDTPVESIKAQFGSLSSLSEVQKIEKQYKECGFKFKDCVFDLKFSDTISGNYRMKILRPGDTRMVYLGDFTHCCQKLYDIGESAMMHGLLNPKAGFWCMTDERTRRVVTQAEVWEKEGDADTLVFDNIEFENDADISIYREAIGAWLEGSAYKNIYMGTGYNEMLQKASFRTIPPLHPGVTPYEIYVISHEEESTAPVFKSEKEAKEALEAGTVTYYDYVYCDSENNMVALKENNVLEPYFTEDFVEETQGEESLEGECEEEEELIPF